LRGHEVVDDHRVDVPFRHDPRNGSKRRVRSAGDDARMHGLADLRILERGASIAAFELKRLHRVPPNQGREQSPGGEREGNRMKY